MLAMLDALGVNLNPAIIWNAIPWSFVVDWVVGVGRWLDQFKSRNLEPVCLIHRYLYSVRIQRSTMCFSNILPTTLGHSPWGGNYLAAQHTEIAYRRSPGMPDLYRAIETSGLNPKEFSLGSALAYLRLTR
jgi:hypothetical protein